jgi:hypothetical protein
MLRSLVLALALTAELVLAGCASGPSEEPPSLVSDMPASDPSVYQLSEQELKYDCKKLTGAMQVRILQIRDYDSSKRATMAARGVQSVATPIFGGTTEGLNPEGQHRRDIAMLEAYNRRLAEKNCRTYDLDAELKSRGLMDMPTPTGGKKP